ncbi:MAG: 30S ribosomal protein S2 [Chloroflexi bacterium RBG_13_50_21]|nr:MAG: 30S ribosomal protein S2 [Chloroflexi bacterium RBG_13_50_21]
MAVVPMKSLLESGVHFGHRTHKWHPAMKPYIFTERNGIHIIDLQKTSKALDTAYNVVRDSVADGGVVLFVGTKRQAQETIQQEAMRASMPYVTARWLGGTLTNWRTIRQRINELERLERMRDSGDFGRITKKEGLIHMREIERLDGLLSGVRKLARPPDMLFVVDVSREFTAIHEANLLNIPVVAMVDTNCDPSNVDYVIPSNDDAIRAIKLVVGKIADAALEGLGARKEEIVEEEVRTIARAGVEEAELSDEELLGEATLAKLVAHPRDVADLEIEVFEEDKVAEFALEGDEIIELLDEEEELEAEEEPAVKEESEADEELEEDDQSEAEEELEADVELEAEDDETEEEK